MSATFNESTAIPESAIKELFRSIIAPIEVLDLYTTEAKKKKSLTSLRGAGVKGPILQVTESDFILNPVEYTAQGGRNKVIIALPSPEDKYSIIEQCVQHKLSAFLLVQTTVMNARRLNDLFKRYKGSSVHVSIVFPYRRINFGTVPCPFDTLWLCLNCSHLLQDRLIFSEGWLTERQLAKRQKVETRQLENDILEAHTIELTDTDTFSVAPPTWVDIVSKLPTPAAASVLVADLLQEGSLAP